MKTRIRWILAVVLVVDLGLAIAFLGGALDPILAEGPATAPPDDAVAGAIAPDEAVDTEAWLAVGEELSRRSEELERMEEELSELLRAPEILRRAGLDVPGETATAKAGAPDSGPGVVSEDFLRLQRAYENMEPESAARALIELAGRDREAVVELLLGWKPRTSGAILDAVTQVKPGLAADLSYEIWTRRGKNPPPPASEDR